MNFNRFSNLVNFDDSDNEYIEQIEQIDNINQKNAILTKKNLSLMNNKFVGVQLCKKEPEIVIEAKTILLKRLVSTLKYKVSNGFKSVYKSDSIFELLINKPIYNFIRRIAYGREDNYTGIGLALFQYKYFDTNINIVISYDYGSCSGCDSDMALEDLLYNAKREIVMARLENDLREKFNGFKFFLDFNEACSYVKNVGKSENIKMNFLKNLKKTNNITKSLTLSDFLPKKSAVC